MSVSRVGRRAILQLATRTSVATLLASRAASALPRMPVGGRIALRVPFPVATIDPHRLDDPTAAIFGDALFDTLFVPSEGGAFVASLAEGDPEPDGAALRVKIRAGLRSAKGRAIGAREIASSLARSRAAGASAWLADVPPPKVGTDALVFGTRDAARLVRALASPLTAIVPPGFTADAPDGTGPFKTSTREGGIALVKNPFAARGPAFLDEVVVRAAPDIGASLLAFESATDDIGWHGLGKHEPRARALAFDFGVVGWAVLSTGRDALDWDATGVAQRLCDGIEPSKLGYLKLGPPWTPDSAQGWGGPPTSILVRSDAPWLVELATAIAATISRPSHEVTAKAVPAGELVQRRSTRMFGLALDTVRSLAPGSLGAMIALATADNPSQASALALHPPKLGEVSARTLTRTLRSGVVGEIRVQGGRIPDLALAASPSGGFDLGASFRGRRATT